MQIFFIAALALLASISLGQPVCHSQFRRDYFLNDWTYPEPWAQDPVTGGRVHLVFPISATDATPSSGPYTVLVGGYTILVDQNTNISTITSGNVHWIHFEASTAVAADARGVVSLHSPTDSFVTGMGTVKVFNAKGALVGSCVSDITDLAAASASPLTLSYVTSRTSWRELVVHVLNNDNTSSHTLSSMLVNGGTAVTVPVTSIPAKGHQVFVVPLGQGLLAEGAAWTVELLVDNSSWIANGGRLGKEVMFVEGWQHSNECPFPIPQGNYTEFYAFRDTLGMNAFYGFGECIPFYPQILDNASANDFYIMLPDVLAYPQIDTSRLMSTEAGDEVDNHLTDTAKQWRKVLSIRDKFPSVVVYQGGKTNHWAGAFAGMSDVQGIDFYIGACAPHITPALSPMPITGSRDYLRNTRNNHMPLTTWGYSQAICTDCWNTVPNSADFTVQIASAFIAGIKSLMLFMADSKGIGLQAFNDGGLLIRSFSAVGEQIRTGDVQGAVSMTVSPSSAEVMMETIAAPNNTFVVIVSSANGAGYNDLVCEIGLDNHWVFQPQQLDSISVVVTPSTQHALPTGISAAFEAVDGKLEPLAKSGVSATFSAQDSSIVISNVALGVNIVARIFYVQLA